MIESLIEKFDTNAIITMVVSLYGLGLVTFVFRNIPEKIYALIKKQLTTTMCISNCDISFYELCQLLEESGISNRLRIIKFISGSMGYDGDTILKSIGYGTHFIKYQNIWMFITFSINDQFAVKKQEKLYITMTKFGRSHAIFDMLKTELEVRYRRRVHSQSIWTYQASINGWHTYDGNFIERNMDSIFIGSAIKKQLIDSMDRFFNNKAWYAECGLPYQYGLLLYGPPGTGKTSIIRAIATKYNLSIAYLNAQQLQMIHDAGTTIPNSSILAIEDVDLELLANDTKRIQNKEESESIVEVSYTSDIITSLLLNLLDGICTMTGRIVILTTNNKAALNPALFRPGRIDLDLEIGLATVEILAEFLTFHFKKEFTFPATAQIRPVSTAQLTLDMQQGNTPEMFIEKYIISQ